MLYLKDKSNEKIIVKLDDEELSSFQIKTIKINELNELIDFEVFNEGKEIDYYISGLISLESFLIKYGYKVSEDKLLEELRITLTKISDYLLNLSNLKVELDEIYLDEEALSENNEIRFKLIYIPKKNEDEELKPDEIIKRVKEDIKIKTFTGKNEKETYDDFSKVYDELEKEENMPQIAPKWNKKLILGAILAIYALILVIFRSNMEVTLVSTVVFALLVVLSTLLFKFQGVKENFSECDETMVMEPLPTLKKGLFEDRILINSPQFVIGKGEGVNLALSSNLISKRHAMIEKGKLGYYIKDLNSTNHTFVNNSRLLEGEEKYLVSGDKIKFASDNYIYTFEY